MWHKSHEGITRDIKAWLITRASKKRKGERKFIVDNREEKDMEQDFLASLRGVGITSVTSDILKEEYIFNFDVFASLEEEHFTALRTKIKIGQHALLLRLWHQKTVRV